MAFEDLQYLGNEAHVDYTSIAGNLEKNYTEAENQIRAEQPRQKVPSFKQTKKSLFNNFYTFAGDSSNIYLDEDVANNDLYKNPSIENLVKNKKGANRFDYSDFVYARSLGEISNNRLITLRRFQFACTDDIFGVKHEPDIARMVTWSTQNDNKLQDLFKMSFGMNWKKLTAEMEAMQQSTPGIGYSGVIGHILKNYLSPNVNPEDYYDPKYDQNKVYGPVDSIHQTHIRDVGLNFNQDIELTFKYELRSINGINPKTAFIDLLSHILVVTMNEGKFWAGSRYWAGRPPSEYAKRIRHWSKEAFSEFVQSSNVNVKSLLGSLASSIQSMLTPENVLDMATKVLKGFAISKALDFAGRASVPLMNSLLTSDPVGEWHLTVGNPFRPIFVCGNLILEDTIIEVDNSALGYDDFPTGVIVKCRLKHAMPRSRPEIEQMFTIGNARTYWKPKTSDFNKITRTGNYVKESMQGHSHADIVVVGRELYSFAQTQVAGYDKSLQPKPPAGGADQSSTFIPNGTSGTSVGGVGGQ